MNVYKEVEVPARTENQVVGKECDLCGEAMPTTPYAGSDVKVVELRARKGSCWPETDFVGQRLEPDICFACFENVVLPFLQERAKNPGAFSEWQETD